MALCLQKGSGKTRTCRQHGLSHILDTAWIHCRQSSGHLFCSLSLLWMQLSCTPACSAHTHHSLLRLWNHFVMLIQWWYILNNSNVYSISWIVDLGAVEGQWGLPESLFCLTNFFGCIDLFSFFTVLNNLRHQPGLYILGKRHNSKTKQNKNPQSYCQLFKHTNLYRFKSSQDWLQECCIISFGCSPYLLLWPENNIANTDCIRAAVKLLLPKRKKKASKL